MVQKGFKKKFLITLLLALASPSFSPAVAEKEPVKLGATLTLTGGTAFWGVNAHRGMTLAAEELNARGGIDGRPCEIIVEDFGELDLKRAAAGARKLIEVDKVSVLLTQWSEDTEVVLPLATRKKTPILSISGGAKGLPAKSPWLFRVWPSDETFVSEAINFALKRGKKKAAMLAAQSSYFESLRAITEELWAARAGTDIYVQEVVPSATDFRTELLNIKRRGADVIFLHIHLEREGFLLKQAAQLKLDALKIGVQHSDAATVLDVAGRAAEGLVFPQYAAPGPEFSSRFEQRFGAMPEVPAEYAYDAVMILGDVIARKGTQSSAIAEGLLQTKDYPGASGAISLDRFGDRQRKEVELREIRSGRSFVIEGG